LEGGRDEGRQAGNASRLQRWMAGWMEARVRDGSLEGELYDCRDGWWEVSLVRGRETRMASWREGGTAD
jgi:hypothetical protein